MRKSVFSLLCSAGFFAIASSTMSKSPTLPLFAESLGLHSSEIGLVAAASTITGIIVNLVTGTFSDLYGRKKLLVASGVFFATAPFMYLFVNDSLGLTFVRVYHGIATATFMPVSLATVADMYVEDRGEKIGLFSSATLLGRLLAPTAAGLLIAFKGFSEAYFICGIIGVFTLILLTIMPQPKRKVSNKATTLKGKREKKLNFRDVILNTQLLLLGLINATIYFSMQGLETFLPLYLEKFSVETWKIGVLFTVQLLVIIVSKPYMGKLSDELGRTKLIIAGMILMSMVLPFFSISTNYYPVLIVISIFALTVSLTTASLTPLASEIVPTGSYGTAIGVLETIKDFGQALGPIATGVILATSSFTKVFLAMAVLTILITLLFTLYTYKKLRANNSFYLVI